MSTAGGFTLLELIIVMGIATLLGGLGVLSQQALRAQLNLSLAARQLVMDLRLARMHAVTDHVNYRLVFPDGGGSYQAQRKVDNAYRDEGEPVGLPSGVIIADCTARDHSISFVPRGAAGSFGTITVRNVRGEERAVTVNIAGQVRVH